MKYFKYIIIAVTSLVGLIYLTTNIYYHYDLPQYIGEQQLVSLSDTVEVYTDEFGVPHVFAKTNGDLFFSTGYIIARERSFQLSILTAIINGDISSLLGEDYKHYDEYLKNNDMFSIKDINISTIDDEYLSLIESYCLGINTYIDELNGTLPISYKITNSKPRKWTVTDVIKVLPVMINNIAKQNREQFIQNSIKQYYGETRYLEIANSETLQNPLSTSKRLEEIKIEDDILKLIGAAGSLIASDALLISASKTEEEQSILIFDDVWGLQQPTKWFDIHLNGGDFNVEGAVIPGFPIPLVGRNAFSAFAFTGEISADSLNQIFIVSKGLDSLTQIFKQNNDTNRLSTLNIQIDALDNINAEMVIDLLSKTNNYAKAHTVSFIIENYLSNNSLANSAVNILLNWDGDESINAEATVLINTIYKQLLENIFKDELALIGDDIYTTFTRIPEFAESSLIKVLSNNESSWLDDINTLDYKETLSDVILNSVDGAIKEITRKYGTTNLKWGDVSKSKYKHILGQKRITNFLHNLNLGPFPAYGSNSNLNINEFDYSQNFQQVSGSVLRKIYDMSDTNLSYSIMPTGQSGLPRSLHYSDQVDLFTNKSFRVVEFSEESIRSSNKYQKLTLIPRQ